MTRFLLFALLMSTATPGRPAPEDHASPAAGHITGIGGIFFRASDPGKLADWYRDVLGLPLADWGGAMLPTDGPERPPYVVWSPFPADTDYFKPGTRPYMINFAVDDLDAFLARLKARGVEILKRDDSDPSGKFAWIVDPEGTKIELWQPARK